MAATLDAIIDGTRSAPGTSNRLLPVLPALRDLLPGAGLRPGSTVTVTGSTSLALALLAGPSANGSWCAVVGDVPGPKAAMEAGIDLARLVFVPDPGAQWPAVVAALLDALDVVAVRLPERARDADVRRLAARARERRAVLVGLAAWPAAEVRLRVTGSRWEGIGWGHGRLLARQVEVVAEGRGALARPRRARLWLPASDGEIRMASPTLRVVAG